MHFNYLCIIEQFRDYSIFIFDLYSLASSATTAETSNKINMQSIEIKPSSPLVIKVPTSLQEQLVLSNLTLHPVCIYIVPIHKNVISITPKSTVIEAFQSIKINIIAHWHQQIAASFKTKIRVYIWENYDDISTLQKIQEEMFNRENNGNCLLFQQIQINFQQDAQCHLQQIIATHPKYYFARRIKLPNYHLVTVSQSMTQKLLEYCKKLGKIKAFYDYPSEFIIQFAQATDITNAFIQIRDNNDNLAIFAIGCIVSLGVPIISPNVINLNLNHDTTESKNKSYTSNIEHNNILLKKKQNSFQFLSKQVGFDHHHHHHNPSISNKSKVKHSFVSFDQNQSNQRVRRRNKSQQIIRQAILQVNEQQKFMQQSVTIDIDWIKDYRGAQNFQTKHKKQYHQTAVQITKKVLNAAISQQKQAKIYLLLRDSIMVFDATNIANKWAIKFDPIDQQNIHLRTPMLLLQQQIIFGNDSYIYWINLNGNHSTWKYVQRKQIYCLQIVQQLNILLVGGKNFSKLSYLGKSTQRCNIKVYSGGKTGKHDHLFTYDIPNCHGDNVMELKYVQTKPTGTKLVLMLTDAGRIAFIRVRAFNQFQVYSLFQCQQIGIQQLISVKYCFSNGYIVCLEKLDAQNYCLKNLKVSCSYQKVQLSTQSIKLPVTSYSPQSLRVGYQGIKNNRGWITVKQQNGKNLLFWLDAKGPELLQINNNVRSCFILNNGFIFQQKTSIRFKLIKQIYA